MEALTLLQWSFDSLLGMGILLLAWWALASPQLLRAIVLFVAFGLLMAMAWVRLDAPDIALAEVAIGAGLTGALLLAALARLPATGTAKNVVDQAGKHRRAARILAWLPLVLLPVVAAGLGYAVLSLPPHADGLNALVAANLDSSGVRSPVTAVLLNFRGYDTLLELLVMLLALLGVWSLGSLHPQPVSPAGPVLDTLSRILTPVFVMVAAYLMWAGSHAAGGAFQAGAVLGAAGVLLLLAGWQPHPGLARLPLRLALVAGPGLFLVTALITVVLGPNLLQYPREQAAMIIMSLEATSALSIGVTLAALFLGERPRDGTNE